MTSVRYEIQIKIERSAKFQDISETLLIFETLIYHIGTLYNYNTKNCIHNLIHIYSP